MNTVMQQIVNCIDSARGTPDFLDTLFGKYKDDVLQGREQLVLFGAGSLGAELHFTLQRHNVNPVCFCDNDNSRSGSIYCGIPVISFSELKSSFQNSLVIIASHKHLDILTKQMLENGFKQDRILCKSSDVHTPAIFMYSMSGTQYVFDRYKNDAAPLSILDFLLKHQQVLQDAYNLLADQHSKDLFISKFALAASNENFELFNFFIKTYSQPGLELGFGSYDGTPEDYYYFTNDVITLSPDEVYVDVGAYDGDTVDTFIAACRKKGLQYKWIHAFEPEPRIYQFLLKNTERYKNITCNQLGVWCKSQTLRFQNFEEITDVKTGTIDDSGNIEIEVVSLDDYLQGEKVSFIKMDPGGNVIPEAVQGAAGTITRHKPKLALGAYHALESMFEIPLLINSLCPDYKLFLRHNTYHLCDTDLYAVL